MTNMALFPNTGAIDPSFLNLKFSTCKMAGVSLFPANGLYFAELCLAEPQAGSQPRRMALSFLLLISTNPSLPTPREMMAAPLSFDRAHSGLWHCNPATEHLLPVIRSATSIMTLKIFLSR